MKRSERLPELLAPAGSRAALYAAVAGGADAVYLGGRFNARAYAKNFDDEALADAVAYAHLHGVRVYVTLNTLLYDRELSDFLSYAKYVRDCGADAVIVADLGAMRLLREQLPELPVHASTQAFIHNRKTADFYAEAGASRVVAGREMSLADIKALTEEARAEIEVFLHGALCVCHSGQCLFSSLVGGRSGNRGECAQPCRLPYGDGYPLSLCDLSLASHIPSLIASGVSSLKIEGRMKSPSYVYGVSSIYRRLLDENRAATKEENEHLAALFSRGGFTDGYYTGKLRRPMTGRRSEADKEASRALEEADFLPTAVAVEAEVSLLPERPARLTLRRGERAITVTGEIPSPAERVALNAEAVKKQLCKMGGSYLSLREEDIKITLGEKLFLPMGALNALRRAAVSAFCDSRRPPLPEPLYRPSAIGSTPAVPSRTALCYRREQADACRQSGLFSIIFTPLLDPDLRDAPREAGVMLPEVFMPSEVEEVRLALQKAKDNGAEYALCPQMGAISLAKEAGLIPFGDFRLNACNRESLASLYEAGCREVILSPELSLPQLRDLAGGRVITYGRIPLMLTERCFIREVAGCDACLRAVLTDRRGVAFPMLRIYPHRNLILNSLPTYMGDREDELQAAGIRREHCIFTVEDKGECKAVLTAIARGQSLPGACRRLGK